MGNQQLIYIQEEDDNIAKKINKKEIENRIKSRFPEDSFSIIQYESLGKPGIIKCNTCGTELIGVQKLFYLDIQTTKYNPLNISKL